MQDERIGDDAIDWAWAAGLFEGEGSLTFRGDTSAEAIVGMCDADVVLRFATVVGFGAVHVEKRLNPKHRNVYRWSVTNVKDVRTLIERFLPFFGERRRARAVAVLERTSRCLGSARTRFVCRKGHPYNEANTYSVPGSNYRQCRICKRERDDAARQKPEVREKYRVRSAEWRARNPEDARARRRASYHKNKTKEVITMSTVPKAGDPKPANNAKTTTVSDAWSGNYGHPTAGGNSVGGTPLGGSSSAPPGPVPSNPVMGGIPSASPAGSLSQAYDSAAYMEANAGAPTSAAGTQAGPDMGHGATIIVANSGDRPSGDKAGANLGTVGDSGNQGGA